MKKLILFAAILFAGVSVVKAEGGSDIKINGKVQSDLTVKLHPIQSIEVVTNEGAMIEYMTAADYSGEGKESTGSTTIDVVSAGSYTVRVSADDFTTENGGSLSLGTIKVTATPKDDVATGTPQTNATLVNKDLGSALIIGEKGGVNMKYDIKFQGSGSNDYMQVYNSGTNNVIQEYTTTVFYTIAAQ